MSDLRNNPIAMRHVEDFIGALHQWASRRSEMSVDAPVQRYRGVQHTISEDGLDLIEVMRLADPKARFLDGLQQRVDAVKKTPEYWDGNALTVEGLRTVLRTFNEEERRNYPKETKQGLSRKTVAASIAEFYKRKEAGPAEQAATETQNPYAAAFEEARREVFTYICSLNLAGKKPCFEEGGSVIATPEQLWASRKPDHQSHIAHDPDMVMSTVTLAAALSLEQVKGTASERGEFKTGLKREFDIVGDPRRLHTVINPKHTSLKAMRDEKNLQDVETIFASGHSFAAELAHFDEFLKSRNVGEEQIKLINKKISEIARSKGRDGDLPPMS